MQARMLMNGGTLQRERLEYEEVAVTRSPQSVLAAVGSPENWDSSPGKTVGKKRKDSHHNADKKAKFLVRLRSLTKSDSGRRVA